MDAQSSDEIFSDRISDVPRSFIREILKDALQPGTISFAGGLPNRDLFPLDAIKAATLKVLDSNGRNVLQYNNSEGLWELKEFIANRYQQRGLQITPDNILITSGSQQGLDLIGKTLLNESDEVIIEEPGYLGAIQAFAIFRSRFLPVPVSEHGMNVDRLRAVLRSAQPKVAYTVPNFQNPSGVTYPNDNRGEVAEILANSKCLLIEDDPYGELRFSGEPKTSFYSLVPEKTLLLGSFSKIVAPGLRIGWIVAPDHIMQKLIIAKQAADLHTNQLSQCIIFQYLQDNDIDNHIRAIVNAYGQQKKAMVNTINEHFPSSVAHTNPEGGMFLWAVLPKNIQAIDLFERARKEGVVFVPGDPFYINRGHTNALRLNYSCVDKATIDVGIQRLGASIRALENNLKNA